MAGEEINEYSAKNADRNTPIPDPTRLTTQLIDRTLSAYKDVVDTRLSAIDEATKLERIQLRFEVERQITTLREILSLQIDGVAAVTNEKFSAISDGFAIRDTRVIQAATDSKVSLDAALAAQKEAASEQNKANTLAIGKSELATKEQIIALVAQIATSNKAMEDRIRAVENRLERMESIKTGAADQKIDYRQNIGQIIAFISIAAIVITLILRLSGK